jgi:hypothetical protein
MPATILLLLTPLSLVGQEQGTKAVLHVTSVKQEDAADWCTTGKCEATRYTVEGYRPAKSPSEVVRYILECVETIPIPLEPGKVIVRCARVEADGDYEVKILADAIIFLPEPPSEKGTLVAGYTIKSQREEKK